MNRSSFFYAGVGAAIAVPGGSRFVERRDDFDESAFYAKLGRAARIRQVWETVAVRPSVFNNIKNSLNALSFGFGFAEDDVSIAVANHGPSSAFTYSDEIWEKYRIGQFFGIADGSKVVTRNVYYPRRSDPAVAPRNPDDESSIYQDQSIEALQARGVVFLTCHTAVEEQARALHAQGYGPATMTAERIADDILTHLIPGAVVVPGMVAALAVLQARFGYTYATVQS